jgi:AraC-like DNA-binding protein
MMLQKHHFALEKYSRSKVSKQDTKRIVERVINLFTEQQSYLNPKLSLSSLSALLDISPRELSRAINEHQQQNFSEFVNGYRIAKATEMLAEPMHQNTKLASIAFDCGFANVTTFGLAFKSIVSSTPSQYRKDKQNEPSDKTQNSANEPR